MEEYVVAIDIGSSKICAVAGGEDPETGKINVSAFAERVFVADEGMIQNGKVNNLERVADLLDSVLAEIAEQLNAPVQVVNISISGGEIVGQSHTATITRSDADTIIQEDDMDDLLRDVKRTFEPRPGHVLLHILPQFFNVDKRTVSDEPIGHVGLRLGGAFYAITSPETNIRHLHEMVSFVPAKNAQGGDSNQLIEVDFTLFSPIPDTISLLTQRDKDGVAVVNIGRDTTELAIFSRQGLRHVAVIQCAGNKVTHDLMEAYNISFEDAEMLKITCGALPPEQLSDNEIITISGGEEIPEFEVPVKGVLEIIELRIREIAAIVMSEITKAGYAANLSQGIVLSGGTTNLYALKEIFSETTNMHTRLGKPMRNVNRNPFSKLENPKYSTVIGLLLASYKQFDIRVPSSVLHPNFTLRTAENNKRGNNKPKPNGGATGSGGLGGLIKKVKDYLNATDSPGNDTYDKR